MFKRVAKRIRKKEREEELGLDGDMKEMLGMNDIDSDDSDSDSDSSSGSEDGSEDERPARTREGAQDGESEDEDEGEEDEDAEDVEDGVDDEDAEMSGLDGFDDDEDESDEEEDGEPPMSVSEALQNPLYLVSLDPEMKECIVCPGKLIKNPTMAAVHLKSNVCAPSVPLGA